MTSSMHLSGLKLLTDETWAGLNSSTTTVVNATEDKATLYGKEMTVISGRFEPSQFGIPFVPVYQRDVLLGTRTKQAELIEAMTSGQGIPDPIILCLRSDNVRVTTSESSGGRDYLLTGPLALFDGLQRIAAALKAMEMGKGYLLRPLRVLVYIDTNEQLERKAFDQFNHGHTQVGAQVRMRNYLTASPAASAIWSLVDPNLPRTEAELAKAETFPLFGRVQYDQTKAPGDLITLKMMLEMATAIHNCTEKSVPDTINDISVLANEYGQATLVRNVQTFFTFVNDCFPFEGTGSQRYHRQRLFLRALAMLVSYYEDFWGTRNALLLDVPAPITSKLKKLKPELIAKELKGSQAPMDLMDFFVRRLNTGKHSRATRLQPREH